MWPNRDVHGSALESASLELERLDKPVATRIVRRLSWLAENFDGLRPMPLKGHLRGLYKLREGDYRIVYETLKAEKVIVIHLIGHRREVYKL